MSSILWRGRPGAVVTDSGAGVTVEYAGGRAQLSEVTAGQRQALAGLIGAGASEEALADFVVGEGALALAEWYYHLGALQDIGAVECVVNEEESEIGRLVPLNSRFRPNPQTFDADVHHHLSSFAFIRWSGSQWSIESPLSEARVEVAGTSLPTLTPSLLALLHLAGMLEAETAAESSQWSFHDALFHQWSRAGRGDRPWGAGPEADPPIPLPRPVVHDPASRIVLARPTLSPEPGPSFAEVFETRRSVRRYGPTPITSEQLGEFLFRVAADRQVGDSVRRTYPSGGGCYPLEFYLVVNRCDSIQRGTYHYDPNGHALDPTMLHWESFEMLLNWYRSKAALDEIQILVLIALVPERVNRRYDAIGYALALKELGAWYQSAYLVATAIGIAPCAIGSGDSDLAARALGLDPWAASVIGEFVIGSGLGSEA